MEFPSGVLVKRFQGVELKDIMAELEKDEFTGVVKIGDLNGNVLLIEGEAVACTRNESGGEGTWESLLKESGFNAEAQELPKEKARFLLLWYMEVYGYERISKDVAREEVLQKMGIDDPDKKKLQELLKHEGMEHLFKKRDDEK